MWGDSSIVIIRSWVLQLQWLTFVVWFSKGYYQQNWFWKKGIILAIKVNRIDSVFWTHKSFKIISIFTVQKWFYFTIWTIILLKSKLTFKISFTNTLIFITNYFKTGYFNLSTFKINSITIWYNQTHRLTAPSNGHTGPYKFPS